MYMSCVMTRCHKMLLLLQEFYLASFFGFSLYIPYLCPYPGHEALHTAAFGFVLPVVMIATIVVYVIR